jgi:hypothetical protein
VLPCELRPRRIPIEVILLATTLPDFGDIPIESRSPVLVHVHVPKTGGVSVLSLLKQGGRAHLNLYVNNTHFIYSQELLAQTVLADHAIRSLSSHFVLTFPPYLGGRRVLYFTILRDPVEQFVSYLTFIQKMYYDLNDPNLNACLPPDPPSLGLRDFARWVLTEDRDEVPFHENYTVNFLARHSYLALQGTEARFDRSAYRAARLTLAQTLLDQFVYVGLTERLAESIEGLRQIAAHLGIELPPGPVGRENVSCQLRDDLSWIDPSDEVGAMLLRSVEEDRRLYEWTAERFEAGHWMKRLEQATNGWDRQFPKLPQADWAIAR